MTKKKSKAINQIKEFGITMLQSAMYVVSPAYLNTPPPLKKKKW